MRILSVGKDMEHQHSQTALVKIPTLKNFLKRKEIAAHYRDISYWYSTQKRNHTQEYSLMI